MTDESGHPGRGALAAALDGAPMGAVLLGPDGTVRHWNPSAHRLLGWSPAEAVGQPDPSLPVEDRDADADALAEMLDEPGAVRRVITRRRRPDGSTTHVVLESAARVELPDGPGVCIWFDEASDIDTLLLYRNRLLRRLVSATRLDEVAPILQEALSELLGAERSVVLRRCPSGEHLHGVRGLGLDQAVAEVVELPLEVDGAASDAVDGWVAAGTLPVGEEVVPVTLVPMGPPGEGWVLAVCDVDLVEVSALVRDLSLAVADEAWVALQRADLVLELDGKIEILEATNALARSMGLDLDDALVSVTSQAALALSCERAAVYLTEDSTLELAHVHADDAAPASLTQQEQGLRIATEVVRTGQPVLLQDASSSELADGPWHADAGTVAVMGLPLQVRDVTIGALVVAHTVAAPRGFTSLCQQVGAAVAQQAAVAIEHARLFQVERRNVERLRELDRMKADWMAGLTHDLKAPLTGLLGFVHTLRRLTGQVSAEQQREFLNVMVRQADQLVALVEDLLLSARVDAHAVARRKDLVPMIEIVQGALSGLTPEQRGTLQVSDDGVDAPVLADRSHLQRVLQNLLSNAWRHGGEHVELTVGHRGGEVVVSVQDDGPGIPEDERETVFERYRHGESPGSTGLGLYVARGIVEAHDGSLEVVDPVGGAGARFELRIPRSRPQREHDLGDGAPVEQDRRRVDADVVV